MVAGNKHDKDGEPDLPGKYLQKKGINQKILILMFECFFYEKHELPKTSAGEDIT